MSNHTTEGDFDSILEDETLEASEDDLDALEALTGQEALDDEDDDDTGSGESKIKLPNCPYRLPSCRLCRQCRSTACSR